MEVQSVAALAVYIVAVFAGGALAAPGLWHLAQWGAAVWPGRIMAHVAHCPFHRFMDRAFLAVALAGLWPLLKALGVRSWRDLGLAPAAGWGRQLGLGLGLGFLTLGLAAAVAVGVGGRVVHGMGPAGHVAGVVLGALGAAAAVAGVEEVLFRGGVFNGLRRVLPWGVALGLSSGIYALVHFLQRGEVTGAVRWNSGLLVLPEMGRGFGDPAALVPGFVSLTLAGLLLGLAYQATGKLYGSIGIHAGWVCSLKLYQAFTSDGAGQNLALWGTGKLIDGWAACGVLLLVLVSAGLWWRSQKCRMAEVAA